MMIVSMEKENGQSQGKVCLAMIKQTSHYVVEKIKCETRMTASVLKQDPNT